MITGYYRSKLKDSFGAEKYAEGVSEVKEKTNPEYYMTEAFRGDFSIF